MTNLEGCLDCGRQLHEFCGQCRCCKESETKFGEGGAENNLSDGDGYGDSTFEKARGAKSSAKTYGVGRPIKESGDVTDRASTGRKRAALLFPLFPDEPCEWRFLSNCGGGKHPIIGCNNGLQQHRHHGPNKDTLRNEPGNVHRICDNCHNIWHAQNNKDYDPNIKHNPRPATNDELIDRLSKVRYVAD